MEVIFLEKHTYKADIDFDAIKRCIKIDLDKTSSIVGEVTNEMIYSAFVKNPEYYLRHLGYMSNSSDKAENYTVIQNIMDKFFIFCMKGVKQCFYVLKGGEMLDKYDDKDMATLYAKHIAGYVIEA